MAEVKNIRLEDVIQQDLGPTFDSSQAGILSNFSDLDVLPKVLSAGALPVGLLTLAAGSGDPKRKLEFTAGVPAGDYGDGEIEYTPDGIIIRPPRGLTEEEKEKLGLTGKPVVNPPKVQVPTSTGGPPPEEIDTSIVDPFPPIELPTNTGSPPMPPKTIDDYVLKMSNKKSETDADVLDDIKQGVGEFQDTYKEPLGKSSQAAGRVERVGVKKFTDLVPDGEVKMGTLKDNFRNEYNKIANLPDKKTQIESLNKLQEASGVMYDYLINNTNGLKQNYNNLSATKAVETRAANPNSPESLKATKQDLIADYWINKTAEYAASENVPKITDADGNFLPALNEYNFFQANKAVAELREMHKNHPNKKIAEWFGSLPDNYLGARRIRQMFQTEGGKSESGTQQRPQDYQKEIRRIVQENVGYINDSLIPEKSFRSRVMELPKVKATVSIAARKLNLREKFVRDQTENFLAEYFRSRDSGARTGISGVMDADLIIKLVEDAGLFNPLSENFMANSKEFKDYLDIRAKQLPGQDLSHKSTTQNPEEAGIAPFSGVEALTYKLLPEKTNREIQRRLEADAKIALGDKDYKTLERLDREADKYGIETKVTVDGETYSLGMGDDYEFMRDDFIEKYGDDLDRFSKGGIASIKYTTRPLGF